MKKLIFVALLFTVAFNHTTASASTLNNAEPIVKIKSSESTTSLDLYFANLLKKTTYLEIVDVKGKTVYSETISNKMAYAKQLNLKAIPNGVYTVFVEHDQIEVTQPISIEDHVVTVLVEKREEKKAPKVEFKDNAVLFQLAPTIQAKRVTITILDGEEIIYETKEVLTSSIKKRYALDNLYPGDYIFKMTVDDKNYYEFINVQ